MARFDSDIDNLDLRLRNDLEDEDNFDDMEDEDFLEDDLDEDFFSEDLSEFEDDDELKDIFDPAHEDLDLEDDLIDYDDEF